MIRRPGRLGLLMHSAASPKLLNDAVGLGAHGVVERGWRSSVIAWSAAIHRATAADRFKSAAESATHLALRHLCIRPLDLIVRQHPGKALSLTDTIRATGSFPAARLMPTECAVSLR